MIPKTLAIGLSPNLQWDDIMRAIRMIITPWRWQSGPSIRLVEQWFETYFSIPMAVSFNSGRSACYALLQAYGLGKGDEVIIQAFTCVAVAEPILWCGATPRYADIDETYNMDPASLEKSITKKTKAIIVQHTFGYPAQMYSIQKIAQKHNILLIEDCCHGLGATYKGKKVGTLGDAAFFSFGRDKVVSSVFGGMACINIAPDEVVRKLRSFSDHLPFPPVWWIGQQLLHPIISAVVLPTYSWVIGKILLRVCQALGLLSFPVYPEEKEGGKPKVFPTRLPNALAYLAIGQLKKVERFNTMRRQFAAYYAQELSDLSSLSIPQVSTDAIYLRFTIQSPARTEIVNEAKQHAILLGDWYSHTIDPQGVAFSKIGYKNGMCSKAEQAAAQCLNLPTFPRMRMQDAQRVIAVLRRYDARNRNTR